MTSSEPMYEPVTHAPEDDNPEQYAGDEADPPEDVTP